ncbi:Zinc finger, CCCH-type [Corchorus olitorius]|uniref:Zinc finger, CCCH-type n=1 Tax=Corchorus olitorius TaxID=93759 RepID=A0A1R3H4P6_9ROSI|nr:Zinc finger, CCCH-type [Corchorus olitorius]
MSLSTSAAVPRADKDDERRATFVTEQEAHSSDMDIDDDDDQGDEDLHCSSRNEDPCTNYEDSKRQISGKQPAKEKASHEYVVSGKDGRSILERKVPENNNEHREKSKQMDAQAEGDIRRSAAQQNSTGSLSPDVEFNRGNKRPALICDFFARGWCIKGSSCRFLHIKDSENNPRNQSEENVDAADGKKAVQLDEGFRNAAERSISPGSTVTPPSSAGNKIASSSHLLSEGVSPLLHDQNQKLHSFLEISKFPSLQSKDKSMGTSLASWQLSTCKDDFGPSKDVMKKSGHNFPADVHAKPASLIDRDGSSFRNSFLHEYKSSLSGSVTSLGNSYSENQAYRVSTWIKSLPFGPSLSASLGAQRVLDSDRERHTSRLSSLLQSSSPFSRSETEKFPLNDISGDPLHFADYRIKISSDDWEPSVPFRPSFFVTSTISSPQSQYDPLRDGMDLSNAGERSLKFSFSSQGPAILNGAYPPIYGDSTSTGPVVPECNGDKKAASCNRYHENLVNNTCHTSEKDSLTTDANDGTSAADMQNGTLPKEEISSVASHVKDISEMNKIATDHDVRYQRDGARCKNDLKVDRAREKNEIDVEHKADGNTFKESKVMRHFHAALVDLIKELLKPTWCEGHLSKDAHNTIVRKAVDKVIGTIQPDQIPTFESVKQYLSFSQPKIAKLVEVRIFD